MKRLLFISSFIILAGSGILFLALKSPEPLPGCDVKDYIFFCGTHAFNDETSMAGKQLFNANCAACHQLDRVMTGPALRHIGKRYDSISIIKHVNGKQKIKSKGFNHFCVSFPSLSDEDINNILKYTDR
ncbi:cytochrome c [uncultured Psychroserpens sp.]|uniref:c-type cytochrome n=1 Tax=uncultured Psychroserpens sp. TaxID=255436 RepID=UPI002609C73F|nr:cytochrome c [uncultured Psychroserpens sp.]